MYLPTKIFFKLTSIIKSHMSPNSILYTQTHWILKFIFYFSNCVPNMKLYLMYYFKCCDYLILNEFEHVLIFINHLNLFSKYWLLKFCLVSIVLIFFSSYWLTSMPCLSVCQCIDPHFTMFISCPSLEGLAYSKTFVFFKEQLFLNFTVLF